MFWCVCVRLCVEASSLLRGRGAGGANPTMIGMCELCGAIAARTAGDPGPVVLRRLSNAEYTASLRDLTGVATLDPGKEFPVDGAAGEGFTNVGQALVMSPEMVDKYLDAATIRAFHSASAVAQHKCKNKDKGNRRSSSPAPWTAPRTVLFTYHNTSLTRPRRRSPLPPRHQTPPY